MDFATLVRARLAKLGCAQKDLARAAEVADSYISQLLTRRRAPPFPARTDLYPRMEAFLQLEPGALARLAQAERAEEFKQKLGQTPQPLFQGFRELILGKCSAQRRSDVRAIFERQPFGTLERLVTQKLLDVVQRIARRELDSEDWLRLAARIGSRSHEEMRVVVLEFLDADVFRVSRESCTAFVDPMIECWDIDLTTFCLDISLNPRLVADAQRRFEFLETDRLDDNEVPSGLARFLEDEQLSGDITPEESRILGLYRFGGRRPNKLFYYRALQVLRDPLHFSEN